MGKVSDDLPDPLGNPGLGAAQSADELLAQLASSEVDRLLAEAELERPQRAAGGPATALAVALGMPPEPDLGMITQAGDAAPEELALAGGGGAAEDGLTADPEALERVDAETAEQLDKLFDELQPQGEDAGAPPAFQQVEAAAAPAAGMAGAQDPAPDANLTAQLSDLFTQLTGGDAAAPIQASDAFVDPEQQTGAAERQVLSSELLDAAGPLASTASDGELDGAPDIDSVPWYFKPLEWLNAPLAGCSDRMREVLGKVAIVTLINAVAVLLYIVLVRRK